MSTPLPESTPAEAIRPTRTPAFEARLAKRYRAERNFRRIGLGAVVFSVAVLVFLLTNLGSMLGVWISGAAIVRKLMEDYSRSRHDAGGYAFMGHM